MSRLIDADALTEKIVRLYDFVLMAAASPAYLFQRVMRALKEAPTIETESVQHCKLAYDSKGGGIYGTCTACKEMIYIADVFNYCPNCGAKIDGETWETNSNEASE